MNEQEVLQVLGKVGAVITDSHIVYTSGKHGTAYVNKDAVYPHTKETAKLCRAIAEQFADDGVEVVIAPAIGGVILSQWTAHHLSEITGREVFGVYAEKPEESLILTSEYTRVRLTEVHFSHQHGDEEIGSQRLVELYRDEQLVKKGATFVIKCGYDKIVAGKNVLVVEDVLTTGGSAKKVVETTRVIGGYVVGLGVLCNRGGITPQDVADPPKFFALVNIKLDAWEETDCPLCTQGVPLNMEVGKGREFLARNSDKYLVCPNPECRGLAHYINKYRGIYSCPRCGAVPAGIEFEQKIKGSSGTRHKRRSRFFLFQKEFPKTK